MGFNTVALLLNDLTHEIEGGGPFGKSVAKAMRHWPPRDRYDCDFHSGRIVSMSHADYWQTVVVGKGMGYRLGNTDNPPPPEALDSVAFWLRQHGYKVTKPKPKAPSRTGRDG